MKKATLMLAALALVLGISQCKKQEKPQQAGEKQYIELTADNGNDGSKVDVDFATIPTVMNLTWEEGDVIAVSGGAEGTLTLDRGAGSNQGHFSGEITTGSGDVVFTYKKAAQQNRGSDDPDFNNQNGTQSWIKDNLILKATSEYHDNGKYSLKMEMPYAVLKLNLSELVGTQNDVKIKANGNAVATVKSLAKANSAAVFVAMATAENQIYTFSGNGKFAQKEWALEANTFYTAGPDGAAILIELMPVPGGAIDGVFSVGPDQQVYFSQGNLQYCAKGGIGGDAINDATSGQNVGGTWRFAPNQGNVCGNANSSASSTCDKWIDLFGWGTSGFNHNNEKYKPWDYYYYGTYKAYGNATLNLYDNDKTADWGTNTIYVGEAPTTGWRTLNNAEWIYLLTERTMVYGKERTVWTKLNGVSGCVIFPDNFNQDNANFPDAIYSVPEGCVFLPDAGYYEDGDYYGGAYYWSSTYCNVNENTTAYAYHFSSSDNKSIHLERRKRHSVRLVKDIQ